MRDTMTYGMSRAARQVMLKAGCKVDEVKRVILGPDGGEIPRYIQEEATDAMIIASVTEWSLGPVTLESLYEVSDEDRLALSGAIDEVAASSAPLAGTNGRQPQNAHS
jgi:hypothetical protein